MSMTPRHIDVLLVVTSIGSTSIFSVDGSVQGFYTMEKEKIILVPRFGDGSKGDRIPSYIIGGQTRADFVHTMQTMQTFQTLQDHRK